MSTDGVTGSDVAAQRQTLPPLSLSLGGDIGKIINKYGRDATPQTRLSGESYSPTLQGLGRTRPRAYDLFLNEQEDPILL